MKNALYVISLLLGPRRFSGVILTIQHNRLSMSGLARYCELTSFFGKMPTYRC
jgi:hypothetical protein